MSTSHAPKGRALNVLPTWWAVLFSLVQVVRREAKTATATETEGAPLNKQADAFQVGMKQGALLPLTYQHLVLPLETFMGVLPKGYDPATDMMTSSLRVEIAGAMNAQCRSFPPTLMQH